MDHASYSWLGTHPDEASELVALLNEAAPKLGLSGYQYPSTSQSLPRRPSYEISHSLKERVKNASPVPIGEYANAGAPYALLAWLSSELTHLQMG